MSEEEGLAPLRDGYRYPLYRRNDRILPDAWRGPIYLWDIDNTYLKTEWRGLRDLIRIRFEDALDKQPVAGAVELLAGLRRAADPDARPPVYFVSASPKTMREVLERRMLIDGVLHDGICFRDWHKVRYLRDVFGYKLAALLLLRIENPPCAEEYLFGDDHEHDPRVYSLYAAACGGRVRGDALRTELEGHGVRSEAARYIATLAGELPEHDPVAWAFIRRLRRRPDPEEERPTRRRLRRPSRSRSEPEPPVDERVLFVDDYGQAAAVLCALGRIEPEDMRSVLRAVRAAGGGAEPLAVLEELGERGPADGVARVRSLLEEGEREDDA